MRITYGVFVYPEKDYWHKLRSKIVMFVKIYQLARNRIEASENKEDSKLVKLVYTFRIIDIWKNESI